jgi:hypothetical protein
VRLRLIGVAVVVLSAMVCDPSVVDRCVPTDAAGNNVAILTQAPASAYPRQAALFDRLRASLAPRAGSSPS